MKKITFLLLTLCLTTTSAKSLKSFPLWGSGWIIAQGENARIYTSVLPLSPKTIAKITFSNDKDKVIIKYANLKHRDYWGTADVRDDILKQWSTDSNTRETAYDSINSKYGILDIKYKTYDDTVFTLHKKMISLLQENHSYTAHIKQNGKEKSYRGSEGVNKLKKELQENRAYSTERHFGWIERPTTPEDKKIFTVGLSVNKNGTSKTMYFRGKDGSDNRMEISDHPMQDYREKESKKTYIYIWEYDFKTENLGYWQVHIHPEIWYFPRNIDNGKPIIEEELKMDYKEAAEKKKESLKDKDNIDLKYYRNPYLSDSASTIISFSFIEDSPDINRREYLILNSVDIGSKMNFAHIPKKMYRVDESKLMMKTKRVILKLYTDSPEEEERAITLDDRCPGWEEIDRINSETLFPLKNRYDNKLVRSREVNDAIFMYNNCPCKKESTLGGLTKAQLTTYLYKPIPTCDFYDLVKTHAFYERIYLYLNRKNHQEIIIKKINTIKKIIKKRYRIYKDNPDIYKRRKKLDANCPESWIDAEVFKSFIGDVKDEIPNWIR